MKLRVMSIFVVMLLLYGLTGFSNITWERVKATAPEGLPLNQINGPIEVRINYPHQDEKKIGSITIIPTEETFSGNSIAILIQVTSNDGQFSHDFSGFLTLRDEDSTKVADIEAEAVIGERGDCLMYGAISESTFGLEVSQTKCVCRGTCEVSLESIAKFELKNS